MLMGQVDLPNTGSEGLALTVNLFRRRKSLN